MTYRWTDEKQQVQQAAIDSINNHSTHQIGDQIRLIYDPDHPQKHYLHPMDLLSSMWCYYVGLSMILILMVPILIRGKIWGTAVGFDYASNSD